MGKEVNAQQWAVTTGEGSEGKNMAGWKEGRGKRWTGIG